MKIKATERYAVTLQNLHVHKHNMRRDTISRCALLPNNPESSLINEALSNGEGDHLKKDYRRKR